MVCILDLLWSCSTRCLCRTDWWPHVSLDIDRFLVVICIHEATLQHDFLLSPMFFSSVIWYLSVACITLIWFLSLSTRTCYSVILFWFCHFSLFDHHFFHLVFQAVDGSRDVNVFQPCALPIYSQPSSSYWRASKRSYTRIPGSLEVASR